MKILIWVIVFLAQGFLITVLKENGIILGGIPTALLYILTFNTGLFLTSRWDWFCFKRKAKKNGKSLLEYAKSKYNTSIIDLCCRYHADKSELKKRLKECLEAETLTKRDCNVLKMLFKNKAALTELGFQTERG